MSNKKSPVPDLISNEILKALPVDFIRLLQQFYNNILNYQNISSDLLTSKMIMLYKKGDPCVAANYSPIALENTILKTFTQIIINNKLTKSSKQLNLLPEHQSGFRKKRGCTDNIYTLYSLIHISFQLQLGNMYAIFIDFKGAFDNIRHHLLWQHLFNIGISSNLIATVNSAPR